MLKVGITGGIGSGKSIVCEVFKRLGVPVYYADDEAKIIVNSDKNIKEQLIKNYGIKIYTNAGEINKTKLSSIIFQDKNALKKVNSIVHPVVKQHFTEWLKNKEMAPSPPTGGKVACLPKLQRRQGEGLYKYIIKEAALLFESNSYKDLDIIVTIYAPENIRIKRVMMRDKTDESTIKKRMKSQYSDEEKIKKSDYVIYNDQNQLILPQIIRLHKVFLNGKIR